VSGELVTSASALPVRPSPIRSFSDNVARYLLTPGWVWVWAFKGSAGCAWRDIATHHYPRWPFCFIGIPLAWAALPVTVPLAAFRYVNRSDDV